MRIDNHQPEIDALLRRYFPEPEPNGNGYHKGVESHLSDDEVIELCRKAKNAAKFASLFDDGDTTAYDGDDSAADLALIAMLAFFTQEHNQLDRLFRRSALCRRKWEQRPDYRTRTINRVLSTLTETYSRPHSREDASGTGTGSPIGNSTGTTRTEDKKERPRLQPIRFRLLGEPEPRRDLVEGLVPEAHPSLLYGDGGVAKTLIALILAMAVSRGAGNFLGHEVIQSPVGFLDFELDAEEQCRRAVRLAAGDGLQHPPDDLLYMCALGMKPRDAFGDALLACKESGAKLLIADSLSVAMEGDVEAARDVIGFYQDVIAPFREAGIAVLALDHQSKLQAGERYQSKRAFGSVFKSNLARSVIQVEAPERGENTLTLRLRHVKFNFGPLTKPFGTKLEFASDKVTVQAVELEDSELAEEGTLSARDRVRSAVRALGDATRNEVHEKLPDLSNATIKKELHKLRGLGEIEETGEVRDRQQIVRPTGTGTGTYKGTGTGTAGITPDIEERQRDILRDLEGDEA